MDQETHPLVWISTPEHLAQFDQVKAGMRTWKTFFRIQQVPKEFPQVLMQGHAFPIIYTSRAQVSLLPDRLVFEPCLAAANGVYYNVELPPIGELPYKAIIRLNRYLSGDNRFWQRWVRLELDARPTEKDMLLAIGGAGLDMTNMRKQTDELYDEIDKRIPSFWQVADGSN